LARRGGRDLTCRRFSSTRFGQDAGQQRESFADHSHRDGSIRRHPATSQSAARRGFSSAGTVRARSFAATRYDPEVAGPKLDWIAGVSGIRDIHKLRDPAPVQADPASFVLEKGPRAHLPREGRPTSGAISSVEGGFFSPSPRVRQRRAVPRHWERGILRSAKAATRASANRLFLNVSEKAIASRFGRLTGPR